MLAPANRGSSGSRAIDNRSRDKAQLEPAGGYRPVYAEQQSRARRWSGSKLDRDSALREMVFSRWPGLVAGTGVGRLAREHGGQVISHETIYRFIYAQLARTKDYAWRHYLPRGKSKRGRRSRKGSSPASFMAHRRPQSERPEGAMIDRPPDTGKLI